MTRDQIEKLKALYFKENRFMKVGICPMCQKDTYYKTDGRNLYRDPNCSCNKKIKPLQKIDWETLLYHTDGTMKVIYLI